jgi:DNA helicase-2/ATP-dependent DNA helicase PcrA
MEDTPSNLTPAEAAIVTDECTRYANCHKSVLSELNIKTETLDDNQILARELTARLVAEQKDEEKQFLQSDENVAHGLVKVRLEEKKALMNLREQPYFARVMYRERGREIEFKLGLAGFPKERIIDWRKAPISKLYYDYEEGESYDDEIAGVERKGEILLKRAFRGKNGELSAIELKDNSFIFSRGTWHARKKQKQGTFSMADREAIRALIKSGDTATFSRLQDSDGYLPQILSLLTPDQFRLISSDITKPVIIQGSAGTGKTTVALHRLAWLLFEGNSKAREEHTLVVMFNRTLANYVKNVLPELGVHKVRITTFFDWATDVISTSLGKPVLFTDDIPAAIAQLKASHLTLALMERQIPQNTPDLLSALSAFWQSQELQDSITDPYKKDMIGYLKAQAQRGKPDLYDAGYLLHLIHRRDGVYRARKHPAEVDHLVIDEAQDFTAVELKALLATLEDKSQLTLAGDLGQKILENRDFGTWSELLNELGLAGVDVLNLNVAFRSTFQIYELAEYIRDPNVKTEELNITAKFGPEPRLILCNTFADSVAQAQRWIEDITSINNHAIGAVVCKTPAQARELHQALLKSGTHGVRLGDAQHFDFTPGITVTNVHEIKGLEFRNLLVFNPSLGNYAINNPHDRNLLYVAITRAEEKLDFVCYETPSALLPEYLVIEDNTLELEETEDGLQYVKPAANPDEGLLDADPSDEDLSEE